jgi:hypothetical protein
MSSSKNVIVIIKCTYDLFNKEHWACDLTTQYVVTAEKYSDDVLTAHDMSEKRTK